jgi:hypothetical protein
VDAHRRVQRGSGFSSVSPSMATSKMVMTADYAQWPEDGTLFVGDRQR